MREGPVAEGPVAEGPVAEGPVAEGPALVGGGTLDVVGGGGEPPQPARNESASKVR